MKRVKRLLSFSLILLSVVGCGKHSIPVSPSVVPEMDRSFSTKSIGFDMLGQVASISGTGTQEKISTGSQEGTISKKSQLLSSQVTTSIHPLISSSAHNLNARKTIAYDKSKVDATSSKNDNNTVVDMGGSNESSGTTLDLTQSSSTYVEQGDSNEDQGTTLDLTKPVENTTGADAGAFTDFGQNNKDE